MRHIGIALCFTYQFDVHDAIGAIKASGFDSVEPYLDFPANERLLTSLADAGVQMRSAHAGQHYLDEPHRDTETGRQTDVYRSFVDCCSRHSISCLTIHPCFKYSPDPAPEGVRRMQDLVEYAASQHVEIAPENIGTTVYLDYLLQHMPSPSLGLLYDCGHDNISGERFGDVLRRWGDRLKATHISDNDGTTDSHDLPFTGNVDWARLASVFDWSAYTGQLTLEVYLRQEHSLPSFLREARESLGRVRSILERSALVQ